MKYTLRQLEIFTAVAQQQNLTRAAHALALSQSATSAALAELESHFDMQLFDRVGKRLQLNALGQWLLPKAEALLAQARSLESDLLKTPESHLKVGATLTIGNYLAVHLVAQYMEEHPGSQIKLDVENTADITRKVIDFELDVGLIEGEFHHPNLDMEPWREDELVMFAAPNHPLTKKPQLDDNDLLAAQWILRESGSGTRQTFDRAMQGLLPQLNVLLELQHTEAIKRAVESGLGLGCLSRVALEDAFQRERLVPLATPGRNLHRHFYLILHKQKYRSNAIESWLELCRHAIS